ncbi:MAG: DUF1194 domain-containing protein [Rhizobiales bacterium]|nr:DUF1194 domain-containing protein [Hyphomicrobiales bacterium]
MKASTRHAVAALLLAVCLPAFAQERRETVVAVELVLALDSSASVDNAEFLLQLQGVARAFADPDVLKAVDRLRPLGAAIAVMQWGGPGESRVVVPFTHIETGRDAKAFGFVTGLIRRWNRASTTSIASGISDSQRLLEGNGYDGYRKVIDVSGDGEDNSDIPLGAARNAARDAGIIINGLAIESDQKNLTAYYENNVIAGPYAFVETANGFEDFARAIKEKLLRELRPPES